MASHRTVSGTPAQVVARLQGQLALVIPGPPRTKKNHGRRVIVDGQLKTMPSVAWCVWCDRVAPLLRLVMQRLACGQDRAECGGAVACGQQRGPIDFEVNCRALFYRDANQGDAVGYYQGLADVLEKGQVVKDDKWIVSWDGSRLCKDAASPRVEVLLTWGAG